MSNQEQFIGRGEKEVQGILESIFPECTVSAQIPIWAVIKEEDYEILDQEFKNHKCDLVLYSGPSTIVIEVNYKHGEKAAQKWS